MEPVSLLGRETVRAPKGRDMCQLGRRSAQPMRFRRYSNSQQLDKLQRVWAERYLRRCRAKKDTSALNENLELQAVDATAITQQSQEMQSVEATSGQ